MSKVALCATRPSGVVSYDDHSAYYDEAWWGAADIRRSFFMGEYVYAISARAITVTRLADLAQVDAAELPVPPAPYWWW